MKNPLGKIYVRYRGRVVALDYYPKDEEIQGTEVSGHSSVDLPFGFSRTGGRILEAKSRYALICAALEKETRKKRLLEIMGVNQDIDCSNPNRISLTLSGTAVYNQR